MDVRALELLVGGVRWLEEEDGLGDQEESRDVEELWWGEKEGERWVGAERMAGRNRTAWNGIG